MVEVIRLLVIGSPGSGKTSQAINLAKCSGLIHIDGSAILKKGQEGGEGRYSARAVFQEISRCDHQHGFVLSGFPKTLAQARSLDRFLASQRMAFDKVVFLDLPQKMLIRRMKERGRSGENSKKRGAKIRKFAEQMQAIIDFYKVKGNLVQISPSAKERFIAKRMSKLAKNTRKSRVLRKKALVSRALIGHPKK